MPNTKDRFRLERFTYLPPAVSTIALSTKTGFEKEANFSTN